MPVVASNAAKSMRESRRLKKFRDTMCMKRLRKLMAMASKSKKVKRSNGGGNVVIAASPPPLSSVNTYTSWPGGIDPTVRLYNQATML
jgi:hypothetical protein